MAVLWRVMDVCDAHTVEDTCFQARPQNTLCALILVFIDQINIDQQSIASPY